MQGEQLTRLKCYISTGFPCDKNLPTDLHAFWPHKEMLSIESGLITFGNRIIVPKEMRPEMLQYVNEGHQGKERCLLRARNTVFWHKMTYNVYHMPGTWKVTTNHSTTQELPPFPWHTLVTDMFYWKRMDFSNSSRCLFKILHSKEIAKFHISSHLYRTIYDCNRIRPAPNYQK